MILLLFIDIIHETVHVNVFDILFSIIIALNYWHNNILFSIIIALIIIMIFSILH